MSILNVNKINPVGGGSTITIAGIASITGNATATTFIGALTGTASGNTTITNNADNRVVTGGSGNALNGESNLTFNGGETGDAQLTVHAAEANANSDSELILETSNDFATSVVMFKDSTAEAGSIAYNHGDNYIKLSTNGTNGGTERVRIDSSGNLKFDSGFGSVATAYGVRAWIKFNGTGTVSINGSNGISALTDNGTGDYTITFDFTMPDTNYALVGTGSANGGNGGLGVNTSSSVPVLYSTTQIRFVNFNGNSGQVLDGGAIGAAVIR